MSVKALTWEREEADWWVAQPAGMGFGYEVRITDSGRVRVRRGTSNWAYFDGTAEEAKAAFQADFDNLIMWFVDPSNASSQAEIERLKKALEFYADPNRYQGPNQRADVNEQHRIAGYRIDVTRDGGEIARAALSGSKE